MNAPALVKVLCLFAAIVFLYKVGVPLWVDLFSVSAATGLWFGAGPLKTAKFIFLSLSDPETIYLGLVVLLLMGVSNVMNDAGVLKRLVMSLTSLLGGKSIRSSAALPALIGLLPMPGGALLSAPMVETACCGGCQTSDQKAAINFWFRHIWEFWWPLYPGVILASSLFHVPMIRVLTLHLPLTFASVLGGYLFILRPAFKSEPAFKAVVDPADIAAAGKSSVASTLRDSACIVIMVAAVFGLGPVYQAAGAKGADLEYWPVISGVLLSLLWLKVSERITARALVKSIFKKGGAELLLVASTMAFKGVLTRADAFPQVQSDLLLYHLPAIAIIALLPFVSGLVLGLSIGFVGTSFPIVISMLAASQFASDTRFAYFTLAYCAGYTGMMISPVHLCMIFTKDYFKADFLGFYRRLLAPAALTLSSGIGLFLLYKFLFR